MIYKHTTPWSILLLAAMLASTTVHAAKLYKWIDEAGNTHYSQKSPTDKNSGEVISGTPPEAEPEPVDTTPIEIPQPTDLLASQQQADKCQGLYRDLELYKNEKQITDSEGNAMVVSKEMREAKMVEIKAELDQSCR